MGGNLLIGAALGVIIGGIYYYTMASVGKNDFADIDDKGNKIKKNENEK